MTVEMEEDMDVAILIQMAMEAQVICHLVIVMETMEVLRFSFYNHSFFSKILSVDEFCLVNYFFSIHCYNYCFICGSLVEVLLMELMEVMLRDGLTLLGNQFIFFLCSTFNYYYSVFQVSTFFPLHTAKRLLSLIFSLKCLITRQY